MNVFIKLNEPLGNGLGPNFYLTSNIGVVTPFLVTKSQLLSGLLVTVTDGATKIKITSQSHCTNFIEINIAGATTTTTTIQPPITTTTTSIQPSTTTTTTIEPTTTTTTTQSDITTTTSSSTSSTTTSTSTTTTTTLPIIYRCTYNFINPDYQPPNVPQMMDGFNFLYPIDFNTFTLLDFTVDGIQYATGQTLTVGFGGDPVLYGIGLDGLTYPMNVNDWINNIGAPGITFYDNMRRVDLNVLVSTTYTIHIFKADVNVDYYFSSEYGFGINDAMVTYGSRDCIIL
jgi:hypothetical protein